MLNVRSNLLLTLVDIHTRITLCTRVTYGTSENMWSSIAAGYISIPGGEGQFVPVIWRVHWDSLTVIQSLATLFLFPLPPLLSLSPFAPSPFILVTTLLLQQLPYSIVIESPAILTEWRDDCSKLCRNSSIASAIENHTRLATCIMIIAISIYLIKAIFLRWRKVSDNFSFIGHRILVCP